MLSAKATDAYEAARGKVAAFVNAASDREIVYTRNASEAINLVAYTWGLSNLGEGDEVIVSVAEHQCVEGCPARSRILREEHALPP